MAAVSASPSPSPRVYLRRERLALAEQAPARRASSMRGYRKCAEPGCDREFIPKSSRNRYCLEHRKTKPRDPAHSEVRAGASSVAGAVGDAGRGGRGGVCSVR